MHQAVFQTAVERLKQHIQRDSSADLSDCELLTQFCTNREETAFAILVQRHGPMILGLCRRLIPDSHQAEDIFQATFLVLIRKASSIQKRDSLSSWLYGVAYRIAQKARQKMSRLVSMKGISDIPNPQPDSIEEVSNRELRQILDEAVFQLPEKYRLPVLLCYVQNKSHDQAAQELRCPKSSLTSRLARARELLQEHLSYRGYVLSSTALISLLSIDGIQGGVSDALLLNTVQSISQFVNGKPMESTAALTLANTFIRKTTLIRFGVIGLVFVGLATFAGTILLGEPQETEKKEAPVQANLDPFGNPLPKDVLDRLGLSRFRHGGRVLTAIFSDDGKTLISSGMDGFIRLWDTKDGKEIRNIHCLNAPFQMALGAEGKTIVGWVDNGIHVWDFATGKEIQYILRDPPVMTKCAMILSPDRKYAILENRSHTIEFLDLTTGKVHLELKGHEGCLTTYVLSPDGKLLASGGYYSARIWSIEDGKELQHFNMHSPVWGLDFSPDGKNIVIGSDTHVDIHDVKTGKYIQQLSSVGSSQGSLHYLSDNEVFGTNAIVNIQIHPNMVEKFQTNKLTQIFSVYARHVLSPKKDLAVAIFPDRNYIPLWEVRTGKMVLPPEGHQYILPALIFSLDGKRIFRGTWEEPIVHVWESSTRKLLDTWEIGKKPGEGPTAFAISPDNKTIAIGFGIVNEQAGIQLRELGSGKEIRTILSSQSVHQALAFTPDGKSLISTDYDEMIYVWEVASGKKIRSMRGPKGEMKTMIVSPNGKTLSIAGGSYGGEYLVQQFELDSGKEIARITSQQSTPISSLAFHPYKPWIATLKAGFVGPNSIGEIVDIQSRQVVLSFNGNKAPTAYYSLAFSPDGRSLFWVDGHSEIHLLETQTGQKRRRPFPGGDLRIPDKLLFSLDGNGLISTATDVTELSYSLRTYPRVPRDPKELEWWWEHLSSSDAEMAYDAVRKYLESGKASLDFLSKKIKVSKPMAPEEEKQLTELVKQLGSNRFSVREKADQTLRDRGRGIEPFLRKMSQQKWDTDTQERLNTILGEWDQLKMPEECRLVRVLEILERINMPEAQSLLEKIPTQEAEDTLERVKRRFAIR